MTDWRSWRARNHDIDIKRNLRDGVYRVNGYRGIDYTTNIVENQCSCPDWQDSRPKGGCKHIRYVHLQIAQGNVEPTTESRYAKTSAKKSPYPDDWQQRRQKVLHRDNWICQQCGSTDNDATLHVHHIVPIAKGGSHHLNNLTTLCQSCHEKVHGTRFPDKLSIPHNRNVNSGQQSTGMNRTTEEIRDTSTIPEPDRSCLEDNVTNYTIDGKTASELTRNKASLPKSDIENSKRDFHPRILGPETEVCLPSWSKAWERLYESDKSDTTETREKTTDVLKEEIAGEFNWVKKPDLMPEAREISIEAPAILPAKKSEVRESLRGRQTCSGTYEQTLLGMIEVITTDPSTTKPGGPDYVNVTSDTRIRIR